METKQFSDAYEQEMNSMMPDAATVENLITAMDAASQEGKVTDLDALPYKSTTTRKTPHFWQEWSLKRRVTTALIGGAGVLAAATAGFVVFLNMTSIPVAPPVVPLDGKVSLQVASPDYSNVYAVFAQAKERERQEYRGLGGGEPANEYAGDGGVAMKEKAPASPTDSNPVETSAEPLADETALGRGAEGGGSADFSDTNIQVEGVQEGDIVKTDGRYLYALNAEMLTVIAARAGQPQIVATLNIDDIEEYAHYSELYVADDRLVAIRESGGFEPYLWREVYEDGDIWNERIDNPNPGTPPLVVADIFDIGNPAQPHKLNSYRSTGNMVSSRMIGTVLYLASNYYVYDFSRVKENEPETFVPFVESEESTGEAGGGSDDADAAIRTLCPPNDIRILPDTPERRTSYSQVVGIDVSQETTLVSQASLLGGSDDLYSSFNNLYLLAYGEVREGKSLEDATTITKVSLDKGQVSIGNSRRIPGAVPNQFFVDESNGYLRVVTSHSQWPNEDYSRKGEWRMDTRVTVLDKNLQIVGKLAGLAEDENLYSCRFIGDIAYFVTFMQVDPLFAVDLSDPTSPKLLNELKVPGFSDYLHPWDDGLLLGLGNDADEDTGWSKELKLSMFDISNPTKISEKHTLIIEGHYSSEASYEHHAILVNREKNLIGFPTDDAYLVYSYDEQSGFKQIAEIETSSYDALRQRGLFIDKVFYLVELGKRVAVRSFSLPAFTPLGSIR